MAIPDENYTSVPPASDKHIPAQEALEFLRDLRRLVAFQHTLGIEGYPRTPELARFMAGKQHPATVAQVQNADTSPPPAPDSTLIDLHAEIKSCQRCQRHQGRRTAITGANTTGVKLLIITDTPSAEDDHTGLPMSGEPGVLLDKMLAAIGLNRAAVHLSLLTRCHAADPPDKAAVDACLPFLLKEISLVSPEVICAMGVLTAQKLLHTAKPLSQLRGKFHDFQGIPLMPTFSPEFLLKNQEMKKATWLDLQMIQKKCAGK